MRFIVFLLTLLLTTSCFAYVGCDGTDDYIQGSIGTIPSRQPITIMAYVKTGTLGTTENVVVGSWDDTNSTTNWLLSLDYNGVNETLLGVFHDGTTGYYYYHGTQVSNDTYYWLTVTFNGTTINTYINTNKASGADTWSIGDTNTEDKVAICAKPDGNGKYFDGDVYIVGIWDVVLTDDEISLIINSGMKDTMRQVEPNNLKALYYLDDKPDGTSGDGATFLDVAGGNNLTGDDGANNSGLTVYAETKFTYQ